MAVKIKILHLVVGLVGVAVFLATGVYMMLGFPELYGGHESIRFMYRANHVYILLASLINLVLGMYYRPGAAGWRRILAMTGSGMVLSAPLILVWAFFHEAPQGTPERFITAMGLYLVLGGVLLHWPNRRSNSNQ